MTSSPFLARPRCDWVAANDLAFAIRDGFPVSPGHTLVVPLREVATWFDASPEEQRAILELVDVVKLQLDAATPRPDGYNVGFNVGEAAGQTVMHLHVHVIPRYRGDMDDPRGGVRYAIPWKGNYKRAAAEPLATGGETDPLVGHLRPLFARATRVDIVAAFVQDSGLDVLKEPLTSVVARGGRVRLVTGDYLDITQAEALKRLNDWQGSWQASDGGGDFSARVVETARLPGASRSFHPKSWRFEGPNFGAAFVGSSNVSRSALEAGIEWNLRVDRHASPEAFARTASAFEAIWARARPLDLAWVAAYAARARKSAAPLPLGDAEAEPLAAPPTPHELQLEALAALAETRAEGRTRALVVMATGLGKTLLAAFDAEVFRRERGLDRVRVLLVAHRRELLGQAAETFRRVLRVACPDLRIGWFADERSELDADVIVASVKKITTGQNLALLCSVSFDYVIVDEVHHADAPSYRKILARLEPGFLLGLTATPERADDGDVLGLFDDNLPYRADLGVGIEHGRLAPFSYFGLKDVVDYANIPWRNREFDHAVLSAAVQTQQRMERLWQAWGEHAGRRTLVFCCSIAHAEFVRGWLADRGVRVVAVYAQAGSHDRADALDSLARGDLEAVCAVDLFNEGVDVPLVDRVVMLRPTESPVLFLQQLGRGLRVAEGKTHLNVIDFVGNHRVFLDRVRTLLSFGREPMTLQAFLASGGSPDLPEGCSVQVELEAIELLRRLLPAGRSEVERAYRELYAVRGERPTLGELFRLDYAPGSLRPKHGGWFDFVGSEGHTTDSERRVLARAGGWLRELETTRMDKCFKMVLLEALIEADALGSGMGLEDLARRSHALLVRSPGLFLDIKNVVDLPDPRRPNPATWKAYWKKNPVDAWTGGAAGDGRWFRLDGDRLVPGFRVEAGDEATLAEMTREVVDYRLVQYRRRKEAEANGGAFECKVTWNQRDPILKLPSRAKWPDVPNGDTDVSLSDGRVWRFRFAKEYINVARAPGSERNDLPDLLRRWFTPAAGRPGTAFRVSFVREGQGWSVEPRGQVIELPRRGNVIAFPTLRAAAGAAEGLTTEGGLEPDEVALPTKATGEQLFAVRAAGDSMDGGSDPIHDGDWLVFRYARGAGLGSVVGRVALVQTDAGAGDHGFQVKRIVEDGGRWLLRSDNPTRPSFPATAETVPVAVLVEHFAPERLAPPAGTRLDREALASHFGLTDAPRTARVQGHLVVVGDQASFASPTRLRAPVAGLRPGETAFVLEPEADGEHWRYRGVGRWSEAEGLWVLPETGTPPEQVETGTRS